ncbi:hypothetical protein JL107_09460 [Nakamurella flavida]|uniref:IclR-ED domain-containing protein n=1 Tax=Nakamurella flavida TaxID=363630 RepID=A0A939C5B2_9ACTN|nr:IclR family transcriptional regulator C-terminal domain-containing protein [Nakamurella flavida]MBM9476669.1 hypothetical protein [Nakamurella flavida]MDP9778893.1 DNA-binding IclR family transcriptional regulator [Nakamurella flavida]
MPDRLATALAVVRAVADRPDPLLPVAVGALAQELGLTTSSASRVSAALAGVGLLDHAEGYGAYRLGRRAATMSGRAGAAVASAVDFALTRLSAATGETVCLVAPAPGGPRVIAVVPSGWTLHVRVRVGDLCAGPGDAAVRVLQDESCRDVERSAADERDQIAVGVRDQGGEVVAALVVHVPAIRTERVLPVAGRVLLAARSNLEAAIVRAPAQHAPSDGRAVRVAAGRASLSLAAAVLEDVCEGGSEVPEIARRLGVRPERVERVLGDAENAGLVRLAGGGGTVTPRWYLHGWHRAVTAAVLTQQVAPLVTAAAQESRTTAYVTVRRGIRSVTVAEAFAEGPLSTQSWLGRPAQMVGADGGALLIMDLDDDQIVAVLPARTSLTAQRTPRDLDSFLQQVRRARLDDRLVLDGYAEDGLTSVAAPVRDASGAVVAAACLVGPTHLIGRELTSTRAVADRLARGVSDLLAAPTG